MQTEPSRNDKTQRSIDLQHSISHRLAELAYADASRAERISRQLAVALSGSQTLTEELLPLFLNVERDNEDSVSRVALAMKIQLEEVTDALIDLRRDLPEWSEFFISMSQR